jgi:hypothetical protein
MITGYLGTFQSQGGQVTGGGNNLIPNNQTASNTLNLTQTVRINRVANISVSNTLVLTQTDHNNQAKKFASNAITFSQTVSVGYVRNRTVHDTITFVGVALADRINRASNTLVLSQAVSYQKYKGTNNTLVLSQALSYSQVHTERPSNLLALSQTVIVAAIRNYTFADTLTFTQTVSAKRVRSFSLAQTLFLHHEVSTVSIQRANNTLVISQAVTVKKIMSFHLSQLLSLVQTLNVNAVHNFNITDQLIFNHSHQRPSGLANQTITVPDVIYTKVLKLVIFQTPQRAITFKPPDFGDTEGGTSSVITQRTITGQLYTYARRNQARKIKYQFRIGRPKALEARSFIKDFLSTPMYMTNWKGELWYGYIINNPFKSTAQSRRMPCDEEEVSIDVEFEGVRVH